MLRSRALLLLFASQLAVVDHGAAPTGRAAEHITIFSDRSAEEIVPNENSKTVDASLLMFHAVISRETLDAKTYACSEGSVVFYTMEALTCVHALSPTVSREMEKVLRTPLAGFNHVRYIPYHISPFRKLTAVFIDDDMVLRGGAVVGAGCKESVSLQKIAIVFAV